MSSVKDDAVGYVPQVPAEYLSDDLKPAPVLSRYQWHKCCAWWLFINAHGMQAVWFGVCGTMPRVYRNALRNPAARDECDAIAKRYGYTIADAERMLGVTPEMILGWYRHASQVVELQRQDVSHARQS